MRRVVTVLVVCFAAAVAGFALVGCSSHEEDPDVAFAQSMIPHHEQAIEMADLALAAPAAASAEVRDLAQGIKGAQDPEIAQMRAWLAEWGAEEMGDDHSGHDMTGMLSGERMAALAAATGTAFDRLWLEGMIAHHEGAVAMAEDVLATTSDARVEALAEAVVAGQTAEIAQMRELLGS